MKVDTNNKIQIKNRLRDETINRQADCKENIIYKITVQNDEVPVLPEHKTVLESLEAANIETHSHCRDGFCGVCRVTLISGNIHYPNGEPLAYVGDDEILPCCCIASSDLSLEID
ncbi:MAG: 2Fe-2S iron-sulfur cluster binding domain-containing protein [Alteromonadaceae bacterium]|nr:2Fe-2S iron-sulfur cluster binding domain-containing protein [Alteromonadaceae bacterium]